MNEQLLKQIQSAYSLATILLKKSPLAPILLIAIVTVALLPLKDVSATNGFDLLIWLIAEQLLDTLLLVFCWREAIRLLNVERQFGVFSIVSVFLFSLAFAGLLTVPTTVLVSSSSHLIQGIALTVLSIGIILYFMYYLFFGPLLLGEKSYLSVLSRARAQTKKDPFLPFRTLAAPLALSFLVEQLLLIPMPDGRYSFYEVTSLTLIGIQKVLTAYLCVSFAVIYERSETSLSMIENQSTSRFLTLSNGLQLLLIGFIIWGTNASRLQTLAPSWRIENLKIASVKDNEIIISLKLEDHAYRFRGFTPAYLSLAGAKHTALSPHPEEVHLQGSDEDIRPGLESKPKEAKLIVKFKTDRTGEQLSKLEDVYLWYRGVKLTEKPLQLKVS